MPSWIQDHHPSSILSRDIMDYGVLIIYDLLKRPDRFKRQLLLLLHCIDDTTMQKFFLQMRKTSKCPEDIFRFYIFV